MTKQLRRLFFYLLLIAVWEVLFRLRMWPEYLFPSPGEVLSSLIGGFRDKTFLFAIGTSLRRILYGYGFSLLLGTVLGMLMGRTKMLDETLPPLFLGIGTLPSICWLPVGLLWFGLNEKAIFFVVIIGTTFAISLAVNDGIKNISPIYLKAASTMGAFGLKRYLNVILPASLPSIVTGMKLGWTLAWRSLMAGEMLFVNLGLGHLLMMGRELNDIKQVFAVMFVIIFIGIVVDRFGLGRLEKRIRQRWGLEKI